MAFRAEEAAARGFDEVKNYLISRRIEASQRERSEQALRNIIAECGPPVDGYPTWHPLVAQHEARYPETYPNERCGYSGLDHTRYFAHGFLTCPYDDGQRVIDSVGKLNFPDCVVITAERLDVSFFADGTTPVLVKCDWHNNLESNHTIPKYLAVPLMLEREVPIWRWSERAESWDTMRPYLLGAPHGNRSSLFVTQDTAIALKKMHASLVDSGMYGPL